MLASRSPEQKSYAPESGIKLAGVDGSQSSHALTAAPLQSRGMITNLGSVLDVVV